MKKSKSRRFAKSTKLEIPNGCRKLMGYHIENMKVAKCSQQHGLSMLDINVFLILSIFSSYMAKVGLEA